MTATKRKDAVTIDLETLVLKKGGHNSRAQGVCVMEAAAWLAGRQHSAEPECVCPIIRVFLINWNDALPNDDDRNRLLKPLLHDILGTKSTPEVEQRRSFMALDWFVREHVPAWFDLTPALKPSGDALRAALEIVDIETAKAVRARVDAARDAAWDATGDAAWDAARVAAWAAARDATGDAAGAAARAAAWDAAGAAAWAAARDAAGAAAWDAAAAAAGDAAGAAARAAAGDALKPTTERLQVSAQALVRRMCAVKP